MKFIKKKYLLIGLFVAIGLLLLFLFSIFKSLPDSSPNSRSERFIVVFSKDTKTFRDQVLKQPGVRFIEDTAFGVEETPAIIIETTAGIATQIRQLPEIFQVETLGEVDVRMPQVANPWEAVSGQF